MMAKLKKGDKAPAFNLTDQDGKKVELPDFKGKKLLLYLYPKADQRAHVSSLKSDKQ